MSYDPNSLQVKKGALGEKNVEVKTQIARPFGPEKAPCYSFPTSRINAYKDYDPLELWIVDPESGFAYREDLTELERPVYIDARLYNHKPISRSLWLSNWLNS